MNIKVTFDSLPGPATRLQRKDRGSTQFDSMVNRVRNINGELIKNNEILLKNL